ncbi:MAG: iron-sulfur cluster assembly protein [Alphaproteobacteria bacterium]
MAEFDNPYKSLLDPEKVKNEPDFFNQEARKEGAVTVLGSPLEAGIAKCSKDDIIQAIQTVEDPEIPINLYDLGLIYDIDQLDNGDIDITMTLTAPNCPVAGEMPKMVADAVLLKSGVGVVSVKLTWQPKWTKDMMSEDAKFALAEIF